MANSYFQQSRQLDSGNLACSHNHRRTSQDERENTTQLFSITTFPGQTGLVARVTFTPAGRLLVSSRIASGQAAIMARYQGHVTAFPATVPLGVKIPQSEFEPQKIVDTCPLKKCYNDPGEGSPCRCAITSARCSTMSDPGKSFTASGRP
jgi:hypothetical protein